MSVSRCREAAQRDAGAVGQQRAFRVLLTPIHGGFASCLATARRLDDAAVHGEVLQVQPDDLVVGLQTQLLELAEHTGGDPLVAASTDRGGRAGRVRDAAFKPATTGQGEGPYRNVLAHGNAARLR